jgi:Domain of unknown function (DUF4115)
MVVVVILVVALIVVVVCGLAAWALRRRGGDDVHSVDGYRSTLHTLEELGKPLPSARARRGGSDQGNPDPTTAGSSVPSSDPLPASHAFRPGSTVRIQREHEPIEDASGDVSAAGLIAGSNPSPDRAGAAPAPLVFSDGSLSQPETIASRSSRHGDRAMSAMNHRPRHWGAPVAAVIVVLLLVGALLVLGSHHHAPRHADGASTSTSLSHTKENSGAHHGGTKHTSTTVTSPPTTVPAQFTPSPGATANDATYVAPAGNVSLVVSVASGACWVEVHDVATGHTLLAMTIESGAQQTITTTGATTILLGAPSEVTVTLNGKPVVLPTGAQSPLTLTFQPDATA